MAGGARISQATSGGWVLLMLSAPIVLVVVVGLALTALDLAGVSTHALLSHHIILWR